MMKRKLLLTAACALLILLGGCQGKSAADTCWDAAKKAGGVEDYVKEQGESIDVEALKQEAREGELSQQFKATALLCALEYRQDRDNDATLDTTRFQFGYPDTRAYAERFLNQINTDEEGFWAALDGAFSPYDCYLPIFAAAKDLDGQTLTKFLENTPSDKAMFRDAAGKWAEANPGKLADIGDALIGCGYFDGMSMSDIRAAYCSSSPNTFAVRTDTAEDAFRFVTYVRDTLLPAVGEESDRGSMTRTSEITGEEYYEDSVMVTITGSGPSLQQPTQDGLPETIDLEGKTVAAFYRNPGAGEFEDGLPELQFMGGFLMALPREEAPATLADADYFLVLTADYELGDFYQTMGGKDTANQQVNSRTSVDLYDAATGAFLRHLGNVLETPPERIFTSYADTSKQYPVPVQSDVLAYLYHNVNNPDAYIALVDHTPANGSEVAVGEPVIFGGWEITYHSARIVPEFETGMYIYTADEGEQFVMAELTITNRGLDKDTFLPMIYYVNEDPIVRVADSDKQTLYDCVDAMMHSACLNNTTLEVGESKQGDLIFEVPDSLVQSGEPMYLAVSLGDRTVYYPLS